MYYRIEPRILLYSFYNSVTTTEASVALRAKYCPPSQVMLQYFLIGFVFSSLLELIVLWATIQGSDCGNIATLFLTNSWQSILRHYSCVTLYMIRWNTILLTINFKLWTLIWYVILTISSSIQNFTQQWLVYSYIQSSSSIYIFALMYIAPKVLIRLSSLQYSI